MGTAMSWHRYHGPENIDPNPAVLPAGAIKSSDGNWAEIHDHAGTVITAFVQLKDPVIQGRRPNALQGQLALLSRRLERIEDRLEQLER